MQSFQERFKSKLSTMGKSGEVELNKNTPINKPISIQIHSPIIKISGRSVIDSQSPKSHEKMSNSLIPSSASVKHKIASPKRQHSQAPPSSFMNPLEGTPIILKKNTDYQPYTIADYNFIKANKYYELGGLGSPTIGTEE